MFKEWSIETITGYKPKTTFYMGFSIADKFGSKAIKETYENARDSWKDDVVMFTELAMVLNWKCWEHYNAGRAEYALLYQDLWMEADEYAKDNYVADDLRYYYETTD